MNPTQPATEHVRQVLRRYDEIMGARNDSWTLLTGIAVGFALGMGVALAIATYVLK